MITSNTKRIETPDKSEIFDYFFYENENYYPSKDGILSGKKGKRRFNILNEAVNEELYYYQRTFENKSLEFAITCKDVKLMMSSYDYLGLIGNSKIEEKAIEAIKNFSTGTGGVRLLTGTNRLHRKLEEVIADFKQTEAAITFSSGYLANLAAVSALVSDKDLIIADDKVHHSIIDAIILSKANHTFYKHNSLKNLEEKLLECKNFKKIFVITEGIFSMDGDICPLPGLVELKKKYGFYLMIDEAHSLGVLGKTGRGVDEHFGINAEEIDVFTGALSKTIPSNGGFIAAKAELIVYLQHEAGPFVFSGALTPSSTAAAIESFEIIKNENWRLLKLWENTNILKKGIIERGFDIANSQSPVIPLILGTSTNTFKMTKHMFESGVVVSPIIYPAVSANKTRLRICASTKHNADSYLQFFNVLDKYKETVI